MKGNHRQVGKATKNSDFCDIANYNLMQNNNNKYGKCELIDFRVDLGSLKVHLPRFPPDSRQVGAAARAIEEEIEKKKRWF